MKEISVFDESEVVSAIEKRDLKTFILKDSVKILELRSEY